MRALETGIAMSFNLTSPNVVVKLQFQHQSREASIPLIVRMSCRCNNTLSDFYIVVFYVETTPVVGGQVVDLMTEKLCKYLVGNVH